VDIGRAGMIELTGEPPVCGIVGLLLRDQAMETDLGRHFTAMLEAMTSRGPDSAGMALYDRDVPEGSLRWSLRAPGDDMDWAAVAAAVESASGCATGLDVRGNVAFLVSAAPQRQVHQVLVAAAAEEQVTVVGVGSAMRLIKDVGTPREICDHYQVGATSGYLAVGHTRMATESAVTTAHSHPFSPAPDLALVHNGSFSNHASIRRRLSDLGIECTTDNDTEVAARYIGWRMAGGDDLEEAMRHVLKEFDGFFTLVVTSARQFSVVRDAFACKPLVVAEAPGYVAVASEYHALADLPGIEDARVFEPQPEEIHTWTV
jgi:glutamate synthase domain-containing protein 1